MNSVKTPKIKEQARYILSRIRTKAKNQKQRINQEELMGENKIHQNAEFKKSNSSYVWLGAVTGMNENMR